MSNELKDNGLNRAAKPRIEVVVFDMDGVLIDSEPVHYESTRRLFADQFGLVLREPVNNEFLGSTDRHMFEVLRERYHLSLPVDELIERRKAIYMNLVQQNGLPWRPGIRELVATLHGDGFRLAVASSGLRRIVEHTLREGGIRRYFEVVVTGDDVHRPKPAPDIYIEAANRLRAAPPVCAAIEDTDVGVRAAKAAGMFVVAFPCGTTADMDLTPADVVAASASRIRGAIDGYHITRDDK